MATPQKIQLPRFESKKIVEAISRVTKRAMELPELGLSSCVATTPEAMEALSKLPRPYFSMAKSAIRSVFREYGVNVPKGHFALEPVGCDLFNVWFMQ